jgi:uncharacterized BrkB/YihY/UPF0761 family membrane protein
MAEPSEPAEPGTAAQGEGPPTKGIRARTAELAARAQTARRAAEERAEDLRRRHATVRLAFDAYEHDRRRAGALLAGGLAYRLFLWLLPFSLVLASTVGLVADLTSRSPQEIADRAGLATALAASIGQAAGQTGRGAIPLLFLGLALMIWAGKSVVKALCLVSAVAWQIRPSPIAHGFRVSMAFAGIATLLIAVPVALRPLYGGPLSVDAIVWLLSACALAPMLAWLLAWLPRPDGIAWTALLPGGVLLAFGLQLLRIVTAIYFIGRIERVDELYGALGIASVLMVWLFVIGRLLVAAMALNAERSRALSSDPQAEAAGVPADVGAEIGDEDPDTIRP